MKKILVIVMALALGGLYFAGCTAGAAADEEIAKETVTEEVTGHNCDCPCCCDHESHKKKTEHHHVKGEYFSCCDAVWHRDK